MCPRIPVESTDLEGSTPDASFSLMPQKRALERARKDRRAGKAASTQASEFVREEMRLVGRGKRAPKSRKQAIAIGLSEARRAGVKLPPRPAARRRRAAR
jgi:hypothetical protein